MCKIYLRFVAIFVCLTAFAGNFLLFAFAGKVKRLVIYVDFSNRC